MARGVKDMHGNVWEWCWGWWADYPELQQPIQPRRQHRPAPREDGPMTSCTLAILCDRPR